MERLMNMIFQNVDVNFFKGIFKSHITKVEAKKFYRENIKSKLGIAKRLHEVYGHSIKYEELKCRCKNGSLDTYIEEIINEVKESMTDEELKLTLWSTLDRDELYGLCVREVSGWK